MMLSLDALVMLATMLVKIRAGEPEAESAKVFLRSLAYSPELLFLAAMMADAGSEAMDLIRFVDSDKWNLEEIGWRIQHFLDRLTWLFVHKGIFKVDGHLAVVREWLKEPHYSMLSSGQGEAVCIGGPGFDEGENGPKMKVALDHMKGWCVLVKEILETEFPSWSLTCSFGVFDLQRVVLPVTKKQYETNKTIQNETNKTIRNK
jgi:hypothetical protein